MSVLQNRRLPRHILLILFLLLLLNHLLFLLLTHLILFNFLFFLLFAISCSQVLPNVFCSFFPDPCSFFSPFLHLLEFSWIIFIFGLDHKKKITLSVMFSISYVLRSWASLHLPKCSGDLKYGPCPPARDWGSRVSGFVVVWKGGG